MFNKIIIEINKSHSITHDKIKTENHIGYNKRN